MKFIRMTGNPLGSWFFTGGRPNKKRRNRYYIIEVFSPFLVKNIYNNVREYFLGKHPVQNYQCHYSDIKFL